MIPALLLEIAGTVCFSFIKDALRVPVGPGSAGRKEMNHLGQTLRTKMSGTQIQLALTAHRSAARVSFKCAHSLCRAGVAADIRRFVPSRGTLDP
jgi:hypothetical protein